jgi:RimJ/RimL family protein N-acetyltransferase
MGSIIEAFPGAAFGYPDAQVQIVDVAPVDADTYARPLERLYRDAWEERFADQIGIVSAEDLATLFDPADAGKVQAREARLRAMDTNERIMAADIVWANEGQASLAGMAHIVRYRPRKTPWAPYPYVKNLNVAPLHHHEGIGALLLDRALAPYPDTRKVATYVHEENEPTIALVEALGFERRGVSRQDTLLGGDAVVTELHYEAPAVGGVRAKLAPVLARHGLRGIGTKFPYGQKRFDV